MISADGRHALTYNGGVYTDRELRESLEAEGVRFNGETDTEVVWAMPGRSAAPRCPGSRACLPSAGWIRRSGNSPSFATFLDQAPLLHAPRRGRHFLFRAASAAESPGYQPEVLPQRIHDFVRMAVPDDGRAQLPRIHCPVSLRLTI